MNKLNYYFKEKSVFQLLEKAARNKPISHAIKYKKNQKWIQINWKTLLEKTKILASSLRKIGIKEGDRIAILSNTRFEWILADLAIFSLNACSVPIYSSNTTNDIEFILKDSNSKIIFAENQDQINKIRKINAKYISLTHIICFDAKEEDLKNKELLYRDFIKNTKSTHTIKKKPLYNLKSIATIVYTSGTTGKSKGVILTNKNLLYEAAVIKKLRLLTENDTQLLFLPLAHIFARVLEISWLKTTHNLVVIDNINELLQNILEIKPTFMAAVPRIYEKIYSKIIITALKTNKVKQIIIKWALNKIKKIAKQEVNNQRKYNITWIIAQKLVFNKINYKLTKLFGNRLKFLISGGAPLSTEINYFFKYSGFKICEGYGLTETTAATTINLPNDIKIGTVGKAVPGTEIKISNDKEILIKGPGVFNGYWKNKKETSHAFCNGWFKSGDIGKLDENNYLTIIDRKKDIIVTASGKNIAPQKIENLVKMQSNLISQVITQGDKRNFISAIITLEKAALLESDKYIKILKNYTDLTKNSIVIKEINKAVSSANSLLQRHEQIKKFKILNDNLSTDKELTPTLKIKRSLIYKQYEKIFNNFYK